MAVGLRLELKQTQQLVMTPQLQQAIKLLQMSNLELTSFLEEQLAENPILVEEGGERGAPDAVFATSGDVPATGLAEDAPGFAAEVFDTGGENLIDPSASDDPVPIPIDPGRRRIGSGVGGTDDGWLENRAGPAPGLREHLTAQIGQFRASALERALAQLLAAELDEHGLLRTPLDEFAARVGATMADVEAALALVQRCEPTGVGARDLGECLALQLAERDRLDPAMLALTRNLDLVAAGETGKLRAACRVDAEDLSEMLAELRTLDPRPCSGFGSAEPQTLIPDVIVRRAGWGGWHVELNSDTLPRLIVDNAYASEIESGGSAEVRRFVSGCRSDAGWLLKSLDQRARTILKVATEIVRHQDGFLEHGIGALRPLNLKMIADAIGMHESTASRVTAGKYMETERGVFELKFFLTNAVGGAGDGEALSAEAVRHRIRGMIGAERADAVLSDDTIVDRLRADGIDIARRTVAKYRRVMNIPSSVERRRQKALAAGG